MSKLENWGDLFKYNKTLLDDDFNKDQSLVVKAKTTATDGASVRINCLKFNVEYVCRSLE
jgi:hypothetical protein